MIKVGDYLQAGDMPPVRIVSKNELGFVIKYGDATGGNNNYTEKYILGLLQYRIVPESILHQQRLQGKITSEHYHNLLDAKLC